MTAVDAVVIVLLLGAAWSGYRQGLISAAFSMVGALAGAIAGIRLAPLAMDPVSDAAAKVAIGIACVIVGVGLGEFGGATLGRLLGQRVTWRPARVLDRGLGLVGHTLAVLIICWMIALPLAKAPYPWLSSAVRNSTVLTKVDDAMPTGLRSISDKLGQLFDESGFPAILDPLTPTPVTDVPAPDPALVRSAAITRTRSSILKVTSTAPSCDRRLEGTGFVIATDRVLTNAHVVAGSSEASVEIDGSQRDATVVLYDPETDIAVLHVPGLGLPALKFSPADVGTGTNAIVAGYPLDGPFTPTAARVRSNFQLRGPDIYGTATVTREVYTLRAAVRPGNSGGPLLAQDGRVLGVIFGAAPDATDVGFALTANEVAPLVRAGSTDSTPALTGACSVG